MVANQKRNPWIGPALLAGGAGWLIWNSLGTERQEKVWKFLNAVAEEQARIERARIAQGQQESPQPKELTLLDLVSDDLGTPRLGLPITFGTTQHPSPDPKSEVDHQAAPSSVTSPTIHADRKWLDVVLHPSVVVIAGKRGGGKSALGYRLLELNRFRLKPYVVGLPGGRAKELPDWLGSVPTLDDLPRDSIALIDEAYLTYHARNSMSEQNRSISQILNLSRQRNQTLIFITQEARQLDKNITSVADVVIFKKPSALQIELERPELRPIARRAHAAFSKLNSSHAKQSYVFSPDSDYEGLLDNRLPSFWSQRLSTAFASGEHDVESIHPASISRNDKRDRAKELRAKGYSLSAIAQEIGVSKSTVVNYLNDYPYKR